MLLQEFASTPQTVATRPAKALAFNRTKLRTDDDLLCYRNLLGNRVVQIDFYLLRLD